MKLIRLYSGSDGQSHFEEISMQLTDSEYGKITNPTAVTHIIFGEIDEREIGWHNPPCSQYVIMLKGAMEIEIGNGSKKIFHEGDILLAEDTTGQGHITRAASAGIRKYIVIPLKSNG